MNFYNEHDPKKAAWLRQLIRDGEIPAGDVDERSITTLFVEAPSSHWRQHSRFMA